MNFKFEKIPSQKGKVAIVTGANIGLGYETTLAFAKKQIKVIMACRNVEKAELARNQILKQIPNAELVIIKLELNKLSSVRSFAQEYLQNYESLDLLINNAGIMIPPYAITEDGYESQFQVNYLSHFLLTGLLLPLLEKTPKSRIVNLSSNAHKNGKINFNDLQFKKKYSAFAAYAQSKLACLMFTFELQRRLEKKGSNTIAVGSHPGVSVTNLGQHIPKWVNLIFGRLFRVLMTQPASNGAEPSIYAALGSDIQGGDYIGPDGWGEWRGKPKKVQGIALAHNEEQARQLWDISEKLATIEYLK